MARTALFLTAITVQLSGADNVDYPVVRTNSGAARGVLNDGVTAFYKVPYAAQPVDDLRFRPPKPGNWTGVHDGTRPPTESDQCLQLSGSKVVGKERCLTLDIYTPNVAGNAAVMFWIHGGGFRSGDSRAGMLYDGHSLAWKKDVVVVSINYRLGALGFLAANALKEESGSTGNYAMQDQQQALKWVQENIAQFGGDPKRVTIFGQSAGGDSVCWHLLMPGSRGLFSGAIMQSAQCNGYSFTLAEKSLSLNANLPKFGGGICCDSLGLCVHDEKFLKCLRGLQGDVFVRMSATYLNAPSPDGAVVPGTFAESLLSGKGNKVPILIGQTKYDASAMANSPAEEELARSMNLWGLWSDKKDDSPQGPYERELLEKQLSSTGHPVKLSNEEWLQVEREYPLSAYKGPAHRMNAMVTHASFENGHGLGRQAWIGTCASQLAAKQYARFSGKSVWVYEWNGIDGHDFLQHTDELPFVFQHAHTLVGQGLGFPTYLAKVNINPSALARMEEIFGDYWTQFAKYQDPNKEGLPKWTPYDSSKGVLQIDDTPTVAPSLVQLKCEFWQRLLIGRHTEVTYDDHAKSMLYV